MRTVKLQVMPTARDEHPSMDGPFTLLTPRGLGEAVYTEIQGHARLITDPDEVRQFSERCGITRAQALTPKKSLMLIEKMLGEL
ncbi:Scr1 family TA system antitoxin-like transcriptional regulator [Streptomyces sp. NPDC057697]|uniref:Scr1 family TA system antitoxin-like transcriptional regulator n=1 Tax=Streptomyces sp. NPDC057697 TaxID=3346219 RepID=UPI0036C48351